MIGENAGDYIIDERIVCERIAKTQVLKLLKTNVKEMNKCLKYL